MPLFGKKPSVADIFTTIINPLYQQAQPGTPAPAAAADIKLSWLQNIHDANKSLSNIALPTLSEDQSTDQFTTDKQRKNALKEIATHYGFGDDGETKLRLELKKQDGVPLYYLNYENSPGSIMPVVQPSISSPDRAAKVTFSPEQIKQGGKALHITYYVLEKFTQSIHQAAKEEFSDYDYGLVLAFEPEGYVTYTLTDHLEDKEEAFSIDDIDKDYRESSQNIRASLATKAPATDVIMLFDGAPEQIVQKGTNPAITISNDTSDGTLAKTAMTFLDK